METEEAKGDKVRTNFCFTYNNYSDDTEAALKTWVIANCKYAVWGHETAPTTGTKHLQGYFQLTKRGRTSTIQNRLSQSGIKLSLFWAKGSARDNLAYCTKVDKDFYQHGSLDTEVHGKRTDLVAARDSILQKKRYKDIYADDELLEVAAKYPRFIREVYETKPVERPPLELEHPIQPWQENLRLYLDQTPQRRRILWVWSHEHSTGKSTYKEYLESVGYDILPGTLELNHLLFAYDNQKIIWFDFAKTSQEPSEKFNRYRNSILEQLSNIGTLLSTKYTSCSKYINSHIVAVSNDPPPHDDLPDRLVEIHATPFEKSTGSNPSTPQLAPSGPDDSETTAPNKTGANTLI